MRTKTPVPKPREVKRAWHLVDAEGQVLGRMAARIATVLQGKHRGAYAPHIDTGDFVVVINVEKLVVTGRKAETRIHRWHTGHPGGLKSASLGERMAKKPEEVLREAVRRMMPKTTLGRKMLKKLKIHRGPKHPHEAQSPKPMDLRLRRKR